MIRFGFNGYGAPDVFTTIEAPVPTPKDNQVLIKVVAFGINPYDLRLRRGEYNKTRPLPFPIVPGTEVAGIVTAVGSDVTDFTVGDRVVNYRPRGGYSEYVTASTSKIAKVPDNMPLTVAAGTPNAGIAAFGVLEMLKPERGKTIIIEGASGAVGSILIQAAKYRGLHVIGTCSARNHDLVMQLGADEVGLYDRENVAAKFANRGDYVVNATSGGDDAGAGTWLRKPGGKLLTLTAPEFRPQNDENYLVLGDEKPVNVQDAFAFLSELRVRAELYIKIAKLLPMTVQGVVTAHAELEKHHVAGKFICTTETDVSTHIKL